MPYIRHKCVVDLLPENPCSKLFFFGGPSHKYFSYVEDLFYPLYYLQSCSVLLSIAD